MVTNNAINLTDSGMASYDGAGTFHGRTLTAGTGIGISNGDGIAGNPTISATASVAILYTEDSGTATPSGNNLNIVGTSAQGISTSGAGSTVTLTAANASATQKGVASFNSSEFTVTAGAVASNAITLSNGNNISISGSPVNLGGTATVNVAGTTQHAVQIGNATNSLTSLTVGTDGQVLIGATAADPAFATLTSSDNSISFTTGAHSLSLQVAGGTSVLKTLTGNSGGAISPTAGNINTLGTGSITIVGSGSTLTTQLTGLTNHNVLVGAGTATITNVAPSATSGVPLISQGSSSDPAFGTAVVAGGGTGSTSFNINGAVYSNTTTTGVLQAATLTSGQLLIGGTTTPAAATITAGVGISVTNGNNSITIAATGSEVAWTDEAISFNAAAGNGYFITAAVTATLPLAPPQGSQISFSLDTASQLTIQANTLQFIRIGSAISTAAGTAKSNAIGDSVTLIYRAADLTWIADRVIGTWTTA